MTQERLQVDKRHAGLTLVELLVVVMVLVVIILVLIPAIPSHHGNVRDLKDQTQIRAILQGMVIWAQNNQDDYPLPSRIDVENTTVVAIDTAKDTTSNVFSMLIYNGLVPTEMFVSPSEANGSVEEYRDYEFDSPSTAVFPDAALWDPAFHASPMAQFNIGTPSNPADIGNNSYAHALPVGKRRPLWGSTFVAEEVVIANRGPLIRAVTKAKPPRVDIDFDTKSNTLLIHGERDAWEGNVGFNDNHVDLVTRLDPLEYVDAGSTPWRDVLFFDEPDDAAGKNAYLGVWTVTGDTKEQCRTWID